MDIEMDCLLHVINVNQNEIIESNRESKFGVDALNT